MDKIKVLENIRLAYSSKNFDELLNIVNSLYGEDLNEELLKELAIIIEVDDKGLRNNIANLFMFNNNPVISNYIVDKISSTDIQIRNLIGDILIKRGNLSTDALMEFLRKSTDDDDKKFAIDILGQLNDKRSKNLILEKLKIEKNENVILACLEALGNLRAEEATSELIKFFNLNELYKPTAVEALGKTGSLESLNFLLSIYKDEDDLVKYSIIESLGYVGNEAAFFFILSELNNSSGAIVYPMINSLYNLKIKYNFDIPFDEKTKNLLLETVFEGEDEFKKAAANLLMEFDDEEIIGSCLKIYGLDHEIDEILKNKFFANSGIVLENLPKVLENNEFKNTAIFYLLEEFLESNIKIAPGEKSNLITSLSSQLNSTNEEIRRISMEILFQIDPESALLFADQMVNDDSIWNKLRLIELIDSIDDDIVRELLEKLSKDEDEMVKNSSVSSLLNRISKKTEV